MNWIDFFSKYKRIIFAILTSIGLLLLLSYVIIYVGNCRFQSNMDKAQTEVNTQLEEANKLDTTIVNLSEKRIEVQANINASVANLNVIQNEVNKAQENSNRAASNVNNVNNTDYNGISPDDANRKRCLAFPNAFGC